MATLTDVELNDLTRANASGRRPVVFVHGLWLLSSSWLPWRDYFEAAGYTTVAPAWPGDPVTVEEARAHPEVFADRSLESIASHVAEVVGQLEHPPILVGHSFGGVITEMLAGRGLAVASVAIDAAPFRGVLGLRLASLKAGASVIRNPANYRRAVMLEFEHFQYGWANTLDETEAREVYQKFHVPGSARLIFSAMASNFLPWTEHRVDTLNPRRGPLLLIAGERDHTVPAAVVSSAYALQRKNPGVTEVASIRDRGHSLTIDHGWREVPDVALRFVERHAPPM